jgi:hypothetical protein
VRDGDLVAFNLSDDTSAWNLGMVRWLRTAAAGDIELGVMRLQQHVVPAAIRVDQGGTRSQPIECLLGHEEAQLRVVLPHITGLASKRLLLASNGREVPITLLEQLESSAVFQMFRCAELHARREEPAAEAPSAEPDPFDKYKSTWDLL